MFCPFVFSVVLPSGFLIGLKENPFAIEGNVRFSTPKFAILAYHQLASTTDFIKLPQ
jgi:hypothetical protein